MGSIDNTQLTLIFGFSAIVVCQLGGLALLAAVLAVGKSIDRRLSEMNPLLIEIYRGTGILTGQPAPSAPYSQSEPPKQANK